MNRSTRTLSSSFFRSLASLASLAALAGCSSATESAASAPGRDLDGTWSTACFSPGNGMYATTTITYANLALRGNYSEFSDAACTTKIHTSDWTGTTKVTGTTGAGETKIDIAFSTFTSTPLTDGNAEQNNAYKYCGFADWRNGVTKDVLGASCMGFSIPAGGKSLDIYKVTGDTLTFGAGATIGTSPSEGDRPTTLNAQGAFTRKK